MASPPARPDLSLSTLDQLVVVDVEATCWHPDEDPALASDQRNECEIIEIGAVRYTWREPSDDSGYEAADPGLREHVGIFRSIVRPRRHPRLSRFCRTLTGLTQHDVDHGDAFADAYPAFLEWCGTPSGIVGSWGSFDQRQFERDCRRGGLAPPPWRPVNLKRWFGKIAHAHGAPRRWTSLSAALAYTGLGFEGTPHRAVADATNTARLVGWANRVVEARRDRAGLTRG